jgi:hypothetical protein
MLEYVLELIFWFICGMIFSAVVIATLHFSKKGE